MLIAGLAVASFSYAFLGLDTETEHKVYVRNSSASVIRTAGGHYYRISMTSPCSDSGGSTNNILTFDRNILRPGETAVAVYRTMRSQKVETIHTEWYRDGGTRQYGLSCEVSPKTCGNDNTKNWTCTFDDEDVASYNAGGTGRGTFR